MVGLDLMLITILNKYKSEKGAHTMRPRRATAQVVTDTQVTTTNHTIVSIKLYQQRVKRRYQSSY